MYKENVEVEKGVAGGHFIEERKIGGKRRNQVHGSLQEKQVWMLAVIDSAFGDYLPLKLRDNIL